MSYSIYIGNATPFAEDTYFGWRVNDIEQEEAPTFPNDGMTGKSNNRHPSYRGWDSFCTEVNLQDLFYKEHSGLMRNHPGVTPINIEHLQVVQEALEAYKAKNPGVTPGFAPDNFGTCFNDPFKGSTTTACLARLIWLEWWMRWAIENCEHPAIYNS